MKGYNKRAKKLVAAALALLLLLTGVAPALAETFSAIVTADSMAVYGEAAMSRKLGTLDKNAVVRVSGYSTTIAKISYEGRIGYAKISDMKRVDDVAKKAVLNAAAPVYQNPDEESAKVSVPSGTQVYLLAQSGDWAQVEKNGVVGYIKAANLTETDDEWNVPEASAVPTDAAVAQQNGITVRDYDAVTVDSVKVYKSASAKAKVLGTLKSGVQVLVKAISQDGWAYIELNGKHGYCKLSGLREGTAEDSQFPETPAVTLPAGTQPGTVTAKTLAVYVTASTGSEKLGTLKKGQTVNVIKTQDGWAYIELNGNYGFCAAKGLGVSDAADGVPSGFKKIDLTATVVTPDARVYASTSTSAENVGLQLGSDVQVVAYNSTWACVKQGDSYGFMSIKALSKAEYEPISGDGEALQTLLKALLSGGYYDAVPTTSYNAAAIAAIKRFQNACGMVETGIADQSMLRIVYSGYAPISGLLYKDLASGDSGDSVSRVQARLYALGYLTRTASLDGSFGTTTVSAVKLFQQASGIEATGKADTATLKALYSTEAKSLPAGTKAADAVTTTTSSSSSTYLDSVPSGLASITSSYNAGMSNAEKLEYAIYLAQSKLGKPYVYGATGPDKFDCSGLTTWIFKAVGVSLKRSAYAQGYDESYTKIEGAANLRRGDVVFFNTISDSDLSDHAGVYIGDGYFIHASSGAHKVVVSNLTTGFYGRVFSWGRRILG